MNKKELIAENERLTKELEQVTKSRDDFMKCAEDFAISNFELAMWQKDAVQVISNQLKTINQYKEYMENKVMNENNNLPKTIH